MYLIDSFQRIYKLLNGLEIAAGERAGDKPRKENNRRFSQETSYINLPSLGEFMRLNSRGSQRNSCASFYAKLERRCKGLSKYKVR